MAFKTNLVLVLLLMVTRTSACPTSVTWEDEHQLVARAKILVLGELDLVLSSSVDCVSLPVLGLFVFDVGSDLINGVNFVKDGDPIWGSVIIGATFLPATFLLAFAAFVWFVGKADGRQRALFLRVLPLLGPVAIAVATPVYIFYVVFVLIRKLKDPSYVSNHMDSIISNIPIWGGKSRFAQPADLLKVFEALLEANIQAIIGTNTFVSKVF